LQALIAASRFLRRWRSRRFVAALSLRASSVAPTVYSGRRRRRYATPPIVAVPAVGVSRPSACARRRT